MKKQITILGSTGSIGTQALEVIAAYPEKFEVYALTANNQADLLIEQARKFNPEFVVIANEEKYLYVKEHLKDKPIKVYAGSAAIADVAEMQTADIVLTAMVGYSGLLPTIKAIKAGKTIALSNKETLVVAGELICKLANEYRSPILPVDSEHSAIFQCLCGEGNNPIGYTVNVYGKDGMLVGATPISTVNAGANNSITISDLKPATPTAEDDFFVIGIVLVLVPPVLIFMDPCMLPVHPLIKHPGAGSVHNLVYDIIQRQNNRPMRRGCKVLESRIHQNIYRRKQNIRQSEQQQSDNRIKHRK